MAQIAKLTKRDGTVILPNTRAEAVIMDDEGTTLTEAINELDSEKAPIASPTFTGTVSGVAINYTATIPSASWTGSSAPYSKAVTVSGITSTDTPIIDIVPTGTYATDQTMVENWSNIYRAVATLNTITFYATEVPTEDIYIQIKVVK